MPLIKLLKHQVLIATVGLPRSGKSTWAREQNYPIVNPDAIRLALHGEIYRAEQEHLVWSMATSFIDSLFLAGHHAVILDATSTTPERRKVWIDRYGVEAVAWQVFDVPAAECIRRALADGRPDLVPVIERMAKDIVWPGSEVPGRA